MKNQRRKNKVSNTEKEDDELKFNVRIENRSDKQNSFKDNEDDSPLNFTIAEVDR